MTKSLTPNQKIWLDALRSGEYEQGEGILHEIVDGKESFCCLGVAAKIFASTDTMPTIKKEIHQGKEYVVYDGMSHLAPDYVIDALSLLDECGSSSASTALSSMNDMGKTFAEIADYFIANLENYVK